MFNIAKRNMMLYFRDRQAVFLSLLTVFIIIGLYVLFLGDLIAGNLGGHEGARFLVDSWIVAGLIASCSITATLGAFGVIVEDNKKNIIKDFKSSPIKFSKLTGGYIISAFSIGIIMSIITLAIGEIYILINGGKLLPFLSIIKVILSVVVITFANSSVLFFIVSFVKSESAYGTLSIVTGTLIGFLLGIYVPIGGLPNWMQSVVKIFPGSYSVSLLRMIVMEEPLSQVFANAPSEQLNNFILSMGVKFSFDGYITNSLICIIVLIVTGIVFFGLSILKLSIKRK